MTMVSVYRPANPVALALAESLLTESGIPYYVQNKNFSSLYPGVAIDLFTACAIMVPEGAEAEARSVLNDLVIAQDEADDADQPVVPSSFDDALDHAPLGKVSAYVERYDATLLFPIPRAGKRAELGIAPEAALPFYGADLWNAYELSWLEPGGKPCVALATFTVPATSPNIVESKSLKLYLNGFNQTAFASASEVCDVLIRDLSAATGAAVAVELVLPVQFSGQRIASFEGFCLDTLPVKIETYTPRPAFLSVHAEMPEVTETLTSHLLKSNCPVTGQPDWGSVQVSYTGKPIDREGLLKYLVSLRLHDEFHEQCVERIFMNLRERCAPQRLSVYARYTRRGGLDINPFRASHADMPVPENGRLARQ